MRATSAYTCAFISQNNTPRVCLLARVPSSTEADVSERNGARMHRLIVWKMQNVTATVCECSGRVT